MRMRLFFGGQETGSQIGCKLFSDHGLCKKVGDRVIAHIMRAAHICLGSLIESCASLLRIWRGIVGSFLDASAWFSMTCETTHRFPLGSQGKRCFPKLEERDENWWPGDGDIVAGSAEPGRRLQIVYHSIL